LNMILDPLFIFGIGPFPRMEAAGAALATVIAHVFVLVAAIIAIQGRAVHIRFRRQDGRIVDFPMMWRIFKIGAPLAISGLLFSLSYMMLTKIISTFGTGAIAALGLGHRIEGISYNVAVGFSLAAATLVGQNLGAGKPERAEKAVWSTILYVSIFLFVVSLFFYFCGGLVIGFFIKDPQVIQEGVHYLKIIAVFEIFLGFEIVFEGAFSGAGNTIPPMLISVPLTWARIPLALLLAGRWGWGSSGIWWAISLTTGLKGIAMALWFRRGRWKHKGV
ncbi:MAG: MATE family efflux transporter, partial [Calditrichaeota bacterium]